ncbi:uncharacterized protein LOC103507566 [Diaphorina citri]|uniref:Uncharacterized protein LOC103507566 n=1 Tax=Diaphorina citri TaxID=121845 RepID=A0A3Q0IPN2_DIACI|nr:uncharacterized protein LOC103507566 [Diaphorina citri]
MTARIILLEGGPPWGFRMTSGAENSNIPLKISRVNPGSKAAQKGIREGDIITSINDQPSMKLNPTEAQKLLKQAGANLKLGLNENGAKSNSKQRPKTQGQLENSKTENEADLKEAPTEPEETPEEFSTVKKKGTWSPATTPEVQRKSLEDSVKEVTEQNKRLDSSEPPVPVWTPKSAPSSPSAQRKFQPVNFKSPTLPRKATGTPNAARKPESPTVTKPPTPRSLPVSPAPSHCNVIPPPTPPPSLSTPDSPLISRSTQISRSSSSELTTTVSHTVQSQSSTSNQQSSSYSSSSIPRASPNLPKSQNPTITLLQKAREGQIPKGASYLEPNMPEKQQQKDQNDNNIDSINENKPKARKVAGVGPTIQEGVPTSLRSEVDDDNKEKWYKKMYDSLHKFGSDQDYVTVRYKAKRKEDGHGYSSEPEGVTGNKYATLDRRRIARGNKENEFVSAVNNVDNISYQNSIKHAMEIYKNQPGRIENYQPGHSSISEKEAKQWWDDMMDIFDGQMEQGKGRPFPTVVSSPTTKQPFMTYALKESGYESDSTLVFKKRDENQQQLSPSEQKIAYKVIQQGGEVPLHGLRKAAPEKPKDPAPRDSSVPVREYQSLSPGTGLGAESPHKYVDSEVTLQYRRPVRNEIKELISEEELARRQAEAMRRIYQEERRRKYLQELHDISSRRHTDNFT